MTDTIIEYTAKDSKINIRDVRFTDAEDLTKLNLKLAEETKYMMREPSEVSTNIEVQQNRIQSTLDDPLSFTYVAEIEDKVVGFISFSSRDLFRISHVGNFIIGVQRDYWGYGIGDKLMTSMLNKSAKLGLKKMSLDVVETNYSAIALYKKHGFEIEGKRIMDHYIGDDIYLDSLVMGKVL